MRKFVTAAIAALTAVAIVSVARAQDPQDQPSATLDVSVSPSNVGTKDKPKAEKISLELESSDPSQTADELTIYISKGPQAQHPRPRTCDGDDLDDEGKTACPSASRVGKGTARAKAGVNTAAPADLTFNVTAFLDGQEGVSFYLEQHGGNIRVRAPGKIKQASGDYRSKLDVQIPQRAREFPTGTFNGLVGLETSWARRRASTASSPPGLPERPRARVPARPRLRAEPDPAEAEKVTATAGANCTK